MATVKRLPSCIQIPLDEKELKDLVSKTKDWAIMHGVGIRSKTAFSEDSLNFAPFVLLPTTFPRKQFEKAVEIQTTLNELMHRVAHNREFLRETLKETIQVDEFTGNLYKIWETVLDEGVAQKTCLGLVRSDYMIHSTEISSIKQVEYNTISVSLAGVGNGISLYNRYVLEELGHFDKLHNVSNYRMIEKKRRQRWL